MRKLVTVVVMVVMLAGVGVANIQTTETAVCVRFPQNEVAGSRVHTVDRGTSSDGSGFISGLTDHANLLEWRDSSGEWRTVIGGTDLAYQRPAPNWALEWESATSTVIRITYKVCIAEHGYLDLTNGGAVTSSASVLPIQSASPIQLYRDFYSRQTIIEGLNDVDDGIVDGSDILLKADPSTWIDPEYFENPSAWLRRTTTTRSTLPPQVVRSVFATTTVSGLPTDDGQVWGHPGGLVNAARGTFVLEGNVGPEGKEWIITSLRHGHAGIPFDFRFMFISPPLPTPTPTATPTATPTPEPPPPPTPEPLPTATPTFPPIPTPRSGVRVINPESMIPGVQPSSIRTAIGDGNAVLAEGYAEYPESIEWTRDIQLSDTTEWRPLVSIEEAEFLRSAPYNGRRTWEVDVRFDNWQSTTSTLVRITYRTDARERLLDGHSHPVLPILSASPRRLYREGGIHLVEHLSDEDDGVIDERDILLRYLGADPDPTRRTDVVAQQVFESITATSTVSGIPSDRLDEWRTPKRLLDANLGIFVLEGDIGRVGKLFMLSLLRGCEGFWCRDYNVPHLASFGVTWTTPRVWPTPTPTHTPVATPTLTSTPDPVPTPVPSPTPIATATATPSPTPTPTATASPTATPTATATHTPVPPPVFRGGGGGFGGGGFSPPPAPAPAPAPAPPPPAAPPPAYLEPTQTPTATPTVTPTATATVRPTATPTHTPTPSPTVTATPVPTMTPTVIPTATATWTPTAVPTDTPRPTVTSTTVPTSTAVPTATPTATPLSSPTATATVIPTLTATSIPASSTSGRTSDVELAGFSGTPTVEPPALVARVPAPATLTPSPTVTPTDGRTSLFIASDLSVSPTVTVVPSPTVTVTPVPTMTPTPTPEDRLSDGAVIVGAVAAGSALVLGSGALYILRRKRE